MSLERHRIGAYYFRKLLGRGGMGEVYLADDLSLSRQVAIKVIWMEGQQQGPGGSTRKAWRSFRREMKALSLLDHPTILPLLDCGKQKRQGRILAYLVMPYLEAGSLDQWLGRQSSPHAPALLAPENVAAIISQLADALQHAHDRGIIHQDVKPCNVLIRGDTPYPGRPDVLLADFGLAKFMATMSSSGQSILGTQDYMAPEQWNNESVPATDQYALAVMAYELLTGELPFRGDSPAKIMYQHLHTVPPPPSSTIAHLPSQVDSVLLKALAKRPEHRFASVSAFAYSLQFAVYSVASVRESSEDRAGSVKSDEEILNILEQEPEQLLDRWPPQITPARAVTVQPLGTRWGEQPRPRDVRRYGKRHVNPAFPRAPLPHGGREAPQAKLRRFIRLRRWPVVGILAGLLCLALLVTALQQHAGGNVTLVNMVGVNTYAITPVSIPATLTAVASIATATAMHPDPYPPYGGTLVLDDPLHDERGPSGLKSSSSNPGDGCLFSGDAYHVTAARELNRSCIATGSSFTDFACEVQMSILTGSTGGMSFRADPIHGYLLLIHVDGGYELEYLGTSASLLLARGTTPALKGGTNQPNVVAVVAQGMMLDLYINQQHIVHVHDGHRSSGQIGLVADASGATGPSEVEYRNMQVWSL